MAEGTTNVSRNILTSHFCFLFFQNKNDRAPPSPKFEGLNHSSGEDSDVECVDELNTEVKRLRLDLESMSKKYNSVKRRLERVSDINIQLQEERIEMKKQIENLSSKVIKI